MWFLCLMCHPGHSLFKPGLWHSSAPDACVLSSQAASLLVSMVWNPSPSLRSPPSVSVCCLMRLKTSLTLFFIFLLQQRDDSTGPFCPWPTHCRQRWGPGEDAPFSEALPGWLTRTKEPRTTWCLPTLQVLLPEFPRKSGMGNIFSTARQMLWVASLSVSIPEVWSPSSSLKT